jgi:ABC-2 type transport system permease protein
MLSIAWKDLQILGRDRNGLMGTFLLPVVFILVYIGLAGFASDRGGDELVALPVVNLDRGGAVAERLVSDLGSAGGMAPEERPEAEAMAALADEDIERVLVIPAGFSEDVSAGKPATLRLVSNTLDRQEDDSVRLAVEGITANLMLEQGIVASLGQLAQMQEADPDFDPATSAALAIPLAQAQMTASRDRPLVTVTQTQPDSLGQGEDVEISGVQIGVPGITVLFIFLTATVTARSIYDERKTGSFRRLLAAPLDRWQILIGKLLPNVVIVVLQVVFVFAAGILLLPLLGLDALDLGNDPLALALLVLAAALCSAALGALIAAMARTEAQIGGISAVILWVLAFVGGCLIPLFLLNESMATIGQLTPHYWAVTGFYDLLTRGLGLEAIVDSLVALLAFAAVFFLVGWRRFEFH